MNTQILVRIALIFAAFLQSACVVGVGYFLILEPTWSVALKIVVGLVLLAIAVWRGANMFAALRAAFS